MTVNSINPVHALKVSGFASQNKHLQAQKPAFGAAQQDSYRTSGKDIAKRLITEGTVGGIVGLGLGLLHRDKGTNLLKAAGINALFLIAFSELFNIVSNPISKVVDKI